MAMIFYLFIHALWGQALSPSSLLSPEKKVKKVYTQDNKRLFYAIDPNENIYFAKSRKGIRKKICDVLRSEGVGSVEAFHIRSVALERLRHISDHEGLKKYKWARFLGVIRSYVMRNQDEKTLNIFSKEDLNALSQVFRSIPDGKCQRVLMKNPRDKGVVTRIIFLISKEKVHFARSETSLRVALQNTEGIKLLKETQENFESFHIQSVFLDDLREIKIVPEVYEKEWKGLLESGILSYWRRGASKCIRAHILKHVPKNKVMSVSREDFVRSNKAVRHKRKGLCLYRDMERGLYYMNRDFHDLRSKLEQDPKIGGQKKPIYYLSEDMLKDSPYPGLADEDKRGCTAGIDSNLKKFLINGLLRHFKGHQIIHKLSVIQEDRDEDMSIKGNNEDNDLSLLRYFKGHKTIHKLEGRDEDKSIKGINGANGLSLLRHFKGHQTIYKLLVTREGRDEGKSIRGINGANDLSLLRHFKGHQTIHKLLVTREGRDEGKSIKGINGANDYQGEESHDAMDVECQVVREESVECEQRGEESHDAMDVEPQVAREESVECEQRGEESHDAIGVECQVAKEESVECDQRGEESHDAMYTDFKDPSFYMNMPKVASHRDVREKKVFNFLFNALPYDQFFLECFFSDFQVLDPGGSYEIEKAYSQYLEETTTYRWIRYLLHFSPYIRKEHIFNLATLFYSQKIMQETGLEEVSVYVYIPHIYNKIFVKPKKESRPLLNLFNRSTLALLCACSSVCKEMKPFDSRTMSHLQNRDWTSESLNLNSIPPLSFYLKILFPSLSVEEEGESLCNEEGEMESNLESVGEGEDGVFTWFSEGGGSNLESIGEEEDGVFAWFSEGMLPSPSLPQCSTLFYCA